MYEMIHIQTLTSKIRSVCYYIRSEMRDKIVTALADTGSDRHSLQARYWRNALHG